MATLHIFTLQLAPLQKHHQCKGERGKEPELSASSFEFWFYSVGRESCKDQILVNEMVINLECAPFIRQPDPIVSEQAYRRG